MSISACFGDVQFRWGHGASSNCRLPHVPQAICWHSAPSHRGSVLLHPSCVVGRASCTCALNLIVAFSPQDSCAHGSLPLTVLVVGDFIHGHMHHGQMVGMASLGTEPCVRACPGFSVGQASRATGEILGPSDATQAGGWHSHLGRRVLSQVPAALQFEPISHVGVVSKYLCTAIPKWRSRQLVGTIRSRGAV